MFVFMNPFAALATIDPVWPVDRSLILVWNPAGVSMSVTSSESPWPIFRVWRLGVRVLRLVSWGLGGPAGTPSSWRDAKLTGSMQLLLHVEKPNVHDRLSMVSAAQYRVASQLMPSTNGAKPGGYHCSSMNAEPASVLVPEPVLVSLSGVQGFCGYDLGSQSGRPNHGAGLSSA